MILGVVADQVRDEAATEAVSILAVLLESVELRVVDIMARGASPATPFWNPAAVASVISHLPDESRVLFELFVAGEQLEEADVESALGDSITECLIAGRLLSVTEGKVLSPHLLVHCRNRSLLVAAPLGHPRFQPEASPYIGPESLWFSSFIAGLGPYDRVLDLCTGSGFLATLPRAKSTVAIDLDSHAVEIARLNMTLNGYDSVEVLLGNLFEPVAGERFDLITANPPFLPSGPENTLPTCGAGGPTGAEVFFDIVDQVPAHLSEVGESLLYSEGFGDREGPDLISGLMDRERSAHHDYTVWLGMSQSGERAGLHLTRVWQATGASEDDAWDAWRTMGDGMVVTHYHHFIVRISRGEGRVRVRRLKAG